MNNFLKIGLTAIALSVAAMTSVSAATVNCPGTLATTDREFSINPNAGSATCLHTGVGNINGAAGDPLLALLGSTYSFIDKYTRDTNSNLNGYLIGSTGSNSGTWSFTLPVVAGFVWENLVLAFKSGQGQFDPDWVAFKLTDYTTSGSWTISSQGLSHINLYGQLVPATVPVPAAGLLMVGALGGLAALRRRRKAV